MFSSRSCFCYLYEVLLTTDLCASFEENMYKTIFKNDILQWLNYTFTFGATEDN